jgi:hypothetical protein
MPHSTLRHGNPPPSRYKSNICFYFLYRYIEKKIEIVYTGSARRGRRDYDF